MVLDFRSIFANGENRAPVDTTLDLSDLDFFGVHPVTKPVVVTGEVTESAEVLRLKVNTRFTYTAPCDRCASVVSHEMSFDFEHILVSELFDDENDELILLDDMKLDLDELLRSDIILSLPTKFLCRPDCRGVCPKCGADLNLAPCDCDTRKCDSRLEALKQLL